MSATNHTTNYNLPQFIDSDKPSWLSDVNGAMSTIDAGMQANKVSASEATSSVGELNASVQALNTLTAQQSLSINSVQTSLNALLNGISNWVAARGTVIPAGITSSRINIYYNATLGILICDGKTSWSTNQQGLGGIPLFNLKTAIPNIVLPSGLVRLMNAGTWLMEGGGSDDNGNMNIDTAGNVLINLCGINSTDNQFSFVTKWPMTLLDA